MNSKKFRDWCLSGCGNAVYKPRKYYCSFKCQQDYQFKLRSVALEAGTYPAKQHLHGFIRRYLVTKFGERCSKCNWAERHPLTGRVPVEVEHLDGNWNNNRADNLTLLCPNCHSLTPTYRGLNRGKGRPKRLGGRENPIGTGPLSKQERSRVAQVPR